MRAADPMDRDGPGYLDRVLGLTALAPGGAIVGAVLVGAVLLLVPSLILWLDGALPFPTLEPRIWLPASITAFVVGAIGVLDGIARRAFAGFAPALGAAGDRSAPPRALTAIPDRLAIAVILPVTILATIGYLSDPVTLDQLVRRHPAEALLIVTCNWIAIAAASLLIVHAFVQLRTVVALHQAATRIDLLDAAPAHAFARLTSATGVGFLLLGVLVLGDPTAGRESLFYAAEACFIVALAVATFALPLRGMHDRLEAEKRRLLTAINERLTLTIARIGVRVESDELDGIDRLGQGQAALIAQRDLVTRLSTWPWSTSTVRAFASTLLLPIAIWLITRLLDRVV